MNPQSRISREYEAIVIGSVNHENLKNKLMNGIETTIGVFKLILLESKPCEQAVAEKVISLYNSRHNHSSESIVSEEIDEDQSKPLFDIKEIANHRQLSSLRVSCTEGKYRMVRRVLHNAGHSVLTLHRYKFGCISLEDTLKEGDIRECTSLEKDWLKRLISS